MFNRRIRVQFLIACALMLVFVSQNAARAQTPDLPAPIIMTMGNSKDSLQDKGTDIWQLAGIGQPFKQRTTWNYNNDPAFVSPDGKWFAYRSIAQVGVTAIKAKRFPRGIGEQIPFTIWLVSMDDQINKRVGEQPADAVLANASNKPDYFITRSNPAWSPDSTKLAWIESTVKGTLTDKIETRLVTYDLASGKQTVLSKKIPLSPGYEGIVFPHLIWGDFFIAVDQRSFEGSGGAGIEATVINFFSPENGALIASTPRMQDIAEFTWIRAPFVKNSTRQLLLILSSFKAYDPQTGQEVALSGKPELYSPNAPKGYAWRIDPQKQTWVEVAPDGSTRAINALKGMSSFLMQSFSVAPDGKGLVYLRVDKVNILYEGQDYIQTPPGRVFSAAWGPTEWRESSAQ